MKLRDSDYLRLMMFVKRKYGINLENKHQLIENRLSHYVVERGFNDYTEFLNYVFADKSGYEIANVINLLTTNHTYFMREVEHFCHLTEEFLPLMEKTCKNHDVRIWSAGCSYGNEPYNLAICVDDYFGTRKTGWDCKILATDISLNALMTAKDGIYKEEALAGLSDKWIDKYFVKISDKMYQVCDKIRNEVVFRYHNLMEPIEFKKKFNLILCRNVMIYFDTPTKDALCQRFYDATEEGGFFYTGHTEMISKNTKYTKVQPAVYQKITRG